MYEQNETIIRDRTMKNQTEILELKNKINELKNSLEGLYSSWPDNRKNQQTWREDFWNYRDIGAKEK